MPNGTGSTARGWLTGGGAGLAGGALGGLGIFYALISGIDHKATTALDVVRQHGEEFVAVRSQFSELEGRFRLYRAEIGKEIQRAAEDRYFGKEAAADQRTHLANMQRLDEAIKAGVRYQDKLEVRQDRLEDRLDQCRARIKRAPKAP